MEFLKSSKRRSLLSELIYILLNIALAIAILGVVWAIDSPAAAFALVLLSKWRVLAVRPRYWFANIQANSVDIMVSLSVVILLYAASGAVIAQCVLTVLYVAWLLFIKPRSKRTFITIQAGTAIFLGVSALMTISYDWMASLVIVFMWLIGYSSARHVLSNYEESHVSFYSLVWGFVLAEIGWLAYHWTFAYELSGVGNIKLVQSAVIATAVSFLAERIYASYNKHGEVRSGDIILPALLSVSLIIILLVFFSRLGAGTI